MLILGVCALVGGALICAWRFWTNGRTRRKIFAGVSEQNASGGKGGKGKGGKGKGGKGKGAAARAGGGKGKGAAASTGGKGKGAAASANGGKGKGGTASNLTGRKRGAPGGAFDRLDKSQRRRSSSVVDTERGDVYLHRR